MSPAEVEWNTIILPLMLTPITIVLLLFYKYVIPAWFASFDEKIKD